MPTPDEDLDAIFASDPLTGAVVEASFNTSPATVVSGHFTEGSDAVQQYGVDIEAVEPSFTCKSSEITAIRNGMTATINATAYTVKRIQKIGTGVSVVYLKTP